VWAATLAELGGANAITVHLREDRRHIQDRDVRLLRETVTVKLNLEMSVHDEIVALACELKPDQATLVPERRQEVTTEGGLNLVPIREVVGNVIQRLRSAGIYVSLFLDPAAEQIELAAALGAQAVELHTGAYALAKGASRQRELDKLVAAAAAVSAHEMALHAGHGLNYQNVPPVAVIPGMHELNIGHAIIARAIWVGMERAVREMKQLIDQSRC
jgi:pyridoxine 5-phosphate synthase